MKLGKLSPAVLASLLIVISIFSMEAISTVSAIVTQENSVFVEFHSGREYSYFYNNLIPHDAYEYCHTQTFASLTPTGNLIPRHRYVDGWGNTGVTWNGVENMIRETVSYGAYPVMRIWLMNLDMSDNEWNTRRRTSPMTISNPQPKISYDAIEAFLLRLNNLVVSLGLEHMIFIPCWEFNQIGCPELRNRRSICWGEGTGGSYRDWDINPSDYEDFMTILVQARDAVAPRIRIGVAPDGMATQISWTSENPNWENSWTREWGGRDGFFYWLNGFRKCDFSFDAFGTSFYPRLSSNNALASSPNLVDAYLGKQWNQRIVELVGLQGCSFILYEYNILGTPRANEAFIRNTYNSVISNIDEGTVCYEAILWYMSLASTQAQTTCNNLARQYDGYPLPEPPEPEPYTSLFEDDFESGSFSSWSGTITTSGEDAEVVDSLSYNGMYSAKFSSNGRGSLEYAYCYEHTSPQSDLYARGYIMATSSGITDRDDCFYLITYVSGNNSLAYVGVQQNRGIVRWNLLIRDGTDWVSAFSDETPTLDQWYCVELHWVEDSANGLGELYVNGELVCSILGKNTASFGSVDLVCFGLVRLDECDMTTVYCDDFRISKTHFDSLPSLDLNRDGKVDVIDLSFIASLFGSTSESANWNPEADLNRDEKIDILDLAMFNMYYNGEYM